MKTLLFLSAFVLVLSSCTKEVPVPDPGSDQGYYPDPYQDPYYYSDPAPDDPSDPGYSDPSDPGTDDPGYDDPSGSRYSRHTGKSSGTPTRIVTGTRQ